MPVQKHRIPVIKLVNPIRNGMRPGFSEENNLEPTRIQVPVPVSTNPIISRFKTMSGFVVRDGLSKVKTVNKVPTKKTPIRTAVLIRIVRTNIIIRPLRPISLTTNPFK